MNESDIAKSIKKSWFYIKAVGIDELFSNPSPVSVSEEFKKIALSEKSTYEELYLSGLSGSNYNIILADYSFMQFGGRSSENLRYAYYPNPFLGASRNAIAELTELRTYVDEGVLDFDEYLHRVSDLRYSQHPPLLRYENAPDQYVDLIHPSSHLHIGHHAQNRWPVRRVLTPDAFTLLILKLFYADFWNESGSIEVGDTQHIIEDVYISSKQDCRIVPDDFFSEKAKRQFFLE